MIKTYPLQYEQDELERIRSAAKKRHLTMKAFMMKAIRKEVEDTENG